MARTIAEKHVPLRSRQHPLNATISRNVRVLMAQNDQSPTDLARALDCDGSTVSRSLSGKRQWSVVDLAILAELFGVSAQLLLEDTLVRNRCFRQGEFAFAA